VKMIDTIGQEIERMQRAAMGSLDTFRQFEEIQKQIALSSSFSVAQEFLNKEARWKNEIDQLPRAQHHSFDHLAAHKSALEELTGSFSAYEVAKRMSEVADISSAMGNFNPSLGTIYEKIFDDAVTTRQLLQEQIGDSKLQTLASMVNSDRYIFSPKDSTVSAATLAWQRKSMAASAGLQNSFALAQAVSTVSIEKAIASCMGDIASQFDGQLDFKNRLRELVGGMSTFDLATTASLARYHGVDGLAKQMAALGLEPSEYLGDEDECQEPEVTSGQKISFEHSALAVTSLDVFRQLLINIIAAYIWAVFIASAVPNPDLDAQNKKISRVESLVEKLPQLIESQVEAIIRHQLLSVDMYFFVKDRKAKLRVTPEAGSGVLALAFPNQRLKLLEEHGKWIKVEFYDYLALITREGWVLKKYCNRLPSRDSDFDKHDLSAALAATRADLAAGRSVQESPEAHLARLDAM